MTYKNVNYIYALINSKNEIYNMSSDFDVLNEECHSYNTIQKNSYKDEIPFKVIEIELGTKISFEE